MEEKSQEKCCCPGNSGQPWESIANPQPSRPVWLWPGYTKLRDPHELGLWRKPVRIGEASRASINPDSEVCDEHTIKVVHRKGVVKLCYSPALRGS